MTEDAERRRTGKAMGKMEATLSDLQDDVAIARKKPRNHFKPGWLLIAIIVAALVGASTFLAVTRLVGVSNGCQLRNEQIDAVNYKLDQLNILFDASLSAPRAPDQPPPSEKILRLYEEFKKPIPHVSCKEFLRP